MSRARTSKDQKPVVCEHCGTPKDQEELDLEKTFGQLMCPSCERNGCFECMPSGRNCPCPECEEADGDT